VGILCSRQPENGKTGAKGERDCTTQSFNHVNRDSLFIELTMQTLTREHVPIFVEGLAEYVAKSLVQAMQKSNLHLYEFFE
jgi:hypothetical protein